MNSVRDFLGNLERDVERGLQTLRNNIRFSVGSVQDDENSFDGQKQSCCTARNNVNRRLSESITMVAAESFDPAKESDDDQEEKRCIVPKTDCQRARLMQAVNGILLFKCLDENQIAQIIDAMMELKVSTGDLVIEQGQDGDNFYVIEKGKFDIYVKNVKSEKDDMGKKIGSYADRGSFGELALMYNTPRAATIIATSPGILWVMDRVTFRRIVLKAAFQKRQYYENLLESVPMLSELSAYERTNVADALIRKTFSDGDRLISQNEPGNELYFVEDGTVKITIKKDNKEVEISRLQKGEYFGELALINKSPRAASAYAIGNTKVAVLDVASFERLLGPCVEVMQRNIKTYNQQLEELMGSEKNINAQ